ncbi:MAG TPA: GNAT family N-acetyltransferase [Trueperaceae bacterium]
MNGSPATPHVAGGRAKGGAKLRWATMDDGARLGALFRTSRPEEPETEAGVREWLESGGAALLEEEGGRVLCAVRWRENGNGWLLDRVCTLPEARSLGFGRWLMTKVEALAIRYNIPELTVELPDDQMAGYYRRLGYRVEEAATGNLARKRVGGTWQLKDLA